MEKKARRTLLLPRELDSIINEIAKSIDITYSKLVTKLLYDYLFNLNSEIQKHRSKKEEN